MEQIAVNNPALVVSVIGKAYVIEANGQLRLLKEGESVERGQVIVTENGAQVAFDYDGYQYQLGENSATALNAEANPEQAPLSAQAQTELEIAQLQAAIADGVDPTEAFEATAAGGDAAPAGDTGAGGVDAGNGGFVSIQRTGATTIAQSGFDTGVAVEVASPQITPEDPNLLNTALDVGNDVVTIDSFTSVAITDIDSDSAIDGDNITNDNTQIFSGTAEAGAEVEVFLNGSSVGSVTADQAGLWSLDHSSTVLIDGNYQIAATATDDAGNTAEADVYDFVVDTVTQAEISDISDDTAIDGDNITNDNTQIFTGNAEAGASVEVFLNGESIGTVEADENGAWSVDHSGVELADGEYAITATATDVAGNTA
ncbi:retention module-containing protein, partial [Alginatibacterium sediminis]